jgi:hypothetical protein
MFSSRRKRQSLISGGIWIDAFGTVDRFAEIFHSVVALLFYVTHLSRVVVIVRQRVVHVSYVEIVPISDGFGGFPTFFDEGVHLTDADSAAPNMGLAHQFVCDPPRLSLRHTYTLLLLPQKHTANTNRLPYQLLTAEAMNLSVDTCSDSSSEMYARNTTGRKSTSRLGESELAFDGRDRHSSTFITSVR